jgi:hypothetical protein
MSRTMIPVEESFAAWRKDPEYVAAYDALEDEFSLAAALMKPRKLSEHAEGEPGPGLLRIHAGMR